MWTAKWILDAYGEGDQSVRWEMYMTYPDLRSYFDEIETRPEKTGKQADSSLAEKPAVSWYSHCCRLVRG